MLPRGSLAITADVSTVVAHAAVAFDVSEEELTGPSRVFPLVTYRHVTMAAARMLGHSFPSICRGLGRYDHKTVLSACRRVAADADLTRRAQAIAASVMTPDQEDA